MAEAEDKVAALGLSEAELERYRKKFNAFDLNKDGIISMREFATVSRVFGYKLTKEEIFEIFDQPGVDLAGQGINFAEFILVMRARAEQARVKGQQIAPYREAFRLFDTKNKGFITADEAYPVLNHELGFDMDKSEQIVDMYDKNRDYRLSLPEFVPFYDRVKQLKAIVRRKFEHFDTNGDGYIDRTEAIRMLEPNGFAEARRKIVLSDVERVFAKFDKDKDGRLCYKEFAAFWNVPIQ